MFHVTSLCSHEITHLIKLTIDQYMGFVEINIQIFKKNRAFTVKMKAIKGIVYK